MYHNFMKTKNLIRSERGFSLVEIMVAGGIFSLVLLGALSAWKYFSSSSTTEYKKIGDLAEFNQLTRDLMRFTEGAGISTAYLNLPIGTANCNIDKDTNNPTTPCIMKVSEGGLILPEQSELPKQMTKKCVQFFKDGRGNLSVQRAYPGKPNNDLLIRIDDMSIKAPKSELVTVWPLVDENSAPFPMIKLHPGGIYLSMLKGPAEISRSKNMLATPAAPGGGQSTPAPKVEYAFFEYPVYDPDSSVMRANISKVLAYKNAPFLVYNTILTNHYTVRFAESIIHCGTGEVATDNSSEASKDCLQMLHKINFKTTFSRPLPGGQTLLSEDEILSLDLDIKSPATYSTNVFAVKLSPIDLTTPYFQDIVKKQNLPKECMSAWDLNKQPVEEYFFPSKAYSVFSADNDISDDIGGSDPLNILHLSHYYTGINLASMSSSLTKGMIVAVPIDIATYSVRNNGEVNGQKSLSLVISKWHAGDMTDKEVVVRIPKLKGPFILTRRIGTSEMGMWYNPIDKIPESKPKQSPPGGPN
jgi:type II secretory pathway pseudopilin PulG